MILGLVLALAVVPERLPLIQETVEVPPGQWRAFDITLGQQPAVVECSFAVVSGRSGVRLALMPRPEMGRLGWSRPHRGMISTGYEREGGFRVAVPKGAYTLVVDNQLEGREPARVELSVALVFTPESSAPQVLSPRRRAVVVALSLAFFVVVAFYAAWKLRGALFGRPPDF
ncbi:MAG: hypothetical protein ABSD27_02315 [Bryobacteraceae bacterium]|jgi:hypothetical protein